MIYLSLKRFFYLFSFCEAKIMKNIFSVYAPTYINSSDLVRDFKTMMHTAPRCLTAFDQDLRKTPDNILRSITLSSKSCLPFYKSFENKVHATDSFDKLTELCINICDNDRDDPLRKLPGFHIAVKQYLLIFANYYLSLQKTPLPPKKILTMPYIVKEKRDAVLQYTAVQKHDCLRFYSKHNPEYIYNILFENPIDSPIKIYSEFDFAILTGLLTSPKNYNPFGEDFSITSNLENKSLFSKESSFTSAIKKFINHFYWYRLLSTNQSKSDNHDESCNSFIAINNYLTERITNINLINFVYKIIHSDENFYPCSLTLLINYPLVGYRLKLLQSMCKNPEAGDYRLNTTSDDPKATYMDLSTLSDSLFYQTYFYFPLLIQLLQTAITIKKPLKDFLPPIDASSQKLFTFKDTKLTSWIDYPSDAQISLAEYKDYVKFVYEYFYTSLSIFNDIDFSDEVYTSIWNKSFVGNHFESFNQLNETIDNLASGASDSRFYIRMINKE